MRARRPMWINARAGAIVVFACLSLAAACGNGGGNGGGADRPGGGSAAWRQIDSFEVSGSVEGATVGEKPAVDFEPDEDAGTASSADQPGVLDVRLESPPGELVSECGLEGNRARIFWTTSTAFEGDLAQAIEGGLEGRAITATGTYFLRVGEGAEDAEEKCQLVATKIAEKK